ELHDHVRTLVGRPNIIVAIDFDRVRERPRVQVVPDLTNVAAVGTELENLRGARRVRGSSRVAAGEHEDVPLRVQSYARCFAEIEIRRKLEEIGHGFESDLRNRLLRAGLR